MDYAYKGHLFEELVHTSPNMKTASSEIMFLAQDFIVHRVCS